MTSMRARLEQELGAIWQEIFPVAAGELDPEVGLFAVGGTSLQAVQLRIRIADEFGVDIPLTVIYAEGSVNRLAELVEEGMRAAVAALSEEEALRLLADEERQDRGPEKETPQGSEVVS